MTRETLARRRRTRRRVRPRAAELITAVALVLSACVREPPVQSVGSVAGFTATHGDGYVELNWRGVGSMGPRVVLCRTASNFADGCDPEGELYRGTATAFVDDAPAGTPRGSYRLCRDDGFGAATACVAPVSLPRPRSWPPPGPFIAHAGGRIAGKRFSNSREALDFNYALGHRILEVDFSWAADRRPVATHDWRWFARRHPEALIPPTSLEFTSYLREEGLSYLDLEAVIEWLELHPDALMIADIKSDTVAALVQIAQQARPELLDQIAPELFAFDHYAVAKELGFTKALLSLYQMDGVSDGAIIRFAKQRRLYGVAMPVPRALSSQVDDELLAAGTPVCVHTINDWESVEAVRRQGIDCIYTDDLLP